MAAECVQWPWFFKSAPSGHDLEARVHRLDGKIISDVIIRASGSSWYLW